MIAALDDVATPIPILSVVIAGLVTVAGVAVLLSAFRLSLRGAVRVPIRIMDTFFGRICISFWCFGLATVGFGRAFHSAAVVRHENLLYGLGFGSLAWRLPMVTSRFVVRIMAANNPPQPRYLAGAKRIYEAKDLRVMKKLDEICRDLEF